MIYTPSSNPIVGETYIHGNFVPWEGSSWGYRAVAAYAVDDNLDGTVEFYYRYFVAAYGIVNSTLNPSLCGGGTWGASMTGTHLGGQSGAWIYYGTNSGSNQFDYKLTLNYGDAFSETNYVGHVGGSWTNYQTTVTLSYTVPNFANNLYFYDKNAWKQGQSIHVFNGSEWKKAVGLYVFTDGAWKKL